jgi:hypothetical protein
MKILKEEAIIVEEFRSEPNWNVDDTDLPIWFSNEEDSPDLIYLYLGKNKLGRIKKDCLVKVAKTIIDLWNEKK